MSLALALVWLLDAARSRRGAFAVGWAFGLGIERMVMRKHHVPDIRMLFESDIRFLKQF